MLRTASLGLLLFSVASITADEIQFVERFALARDREAVLKELIPGTQEYYYYHCLHLQNQQKFADAERLLAAWIKTHNMTSLVHQVLNRQALLTYPQTPEKTLSRLKDRLGLRFDHQRINVNRAQQLPDTLDQKLISREVLKQRALQYKGHVNEFEPASFLWLAQEELDGDRRRALLTRLMHGDYADLPRLIVADLKYRGSRGFGSLAIHQYLLRTQLDECLRLEPNLLNQTNFVNIYIRKLQPGADEDSTFDRQSKRAYLNRLAGFVRRLGSAHNSLKAQVLYQRLLLDRAEGKYDKVAFMEYVKIPRRVGYINADFIKRFNSRQIANLGSNLQAITLLPPVTNDEPLVRSYLERFFQRETSFQAYTPYIRDTYLKKVFAETKLLAGLGDPQEWYAMLTPASLQALRDRVDIDFAHTNPPRFAADKPVRLDVWIKNVPSLIVKVYEINTSSYFRQTQKPVSTNINLDGLVANHIQRKQSQQPPLRRVRQSFEFPEIKKPGIYVIDFIGNGRSSRVVVRKGTLRYVTETTSAGPGFRVFNENNQPLKDAKVWIGGREYETTEKDGLIIVPFTAKPGRTPVILQHGDHCVLDTFSWQGESYQLRASIFADREGLVQNNRAKIIVRAQLYTNGIPVSLDSLKDIELAIRSVNLDGISSTKVIKNFKLFENQESRTEIQVPPRLAQLNVILRAKIKSLTQNKDIPLQSQRTVTLNGIHRTHKTQDVHLARSDSGYRIELLGKSGGTRAQQPVRLALKHREFKRSVQITLRSNDKGHVLLGKLDGITHVTATDAGGTSHTWNVNRDAVRYANAIHASTNETIQIPFVAPKADEATFSLFEIRGGLYSASHRDKVTLKDGMLRIKGLPAGDHDLHLHAAGGRIRIRVTAGSTVGNYVLGNHRILEMRNRKPLQIESVTVGKKEIVVRLQNANDLTRIHVLGTRYEPRHPFSQLAEIQDAEPMFGRSQRSISQYVAGRKLGDEIQYIINRQFADHYPGNMLTRPTLLLNPWAVRKAETGKQNAAGGEKFADMPAEAPGMAARGESRQAGGSRAAGFTSFDFLGIPSSLLENLEIKDGVVRIPRDSLSSFQMLQIVAADPWNTVYRTASLPVTALVHQDLRLAKSLPQNQPHTVQKSVSVLGAGDKMTIQDVASSKFEIYKDVAGLFRLYRTLNGNANLAEFEFLLRWPGMNDAAKRTAYSKYACHELNLFLYKRDRAFFDQVVRPYLKNKFQPTFIDDWLLERDLSGYLEPWRYTRLNTLEKVLLSQRIPQEKRWTTRFIEEQVQLRPPANDQLERLFDTAILTSSLDRSAAPMSGGLVIKNAAEGGKAPSRVMAVDGRFRALSERLSETKADVAEKAEADKSMIRRALDLQRKAGAKKARPAPKKAFPELAAGRRFARTLYQKLDKTMEWAENNYYKVPLSAQNQGLIGPNGFWLDYARQADDEKFISQSFIQPHRNFSETVIALALLDLPMAAEAPKVEYKDGAATIQAAGSLVVAHEQIRPAKRNEDDNSILVSQNFFRHGERYMTVKNQKVDKFVKDEFLVEVVYGCQIVVTNPTSATKKIRLLTQIPVGAIAVAGGKKTNSHSIVLKPYNTHSMEYYFYFPQTGTYPQWPVHISEEALVIASANPSKFKVVAEPSTIDKTSWQYVSQFADADDVLQFLDDNNLQETDLNKIAFRMKDKDFFGKTISKLERRHVYNPTLWSYAIHHNDKKRISEFLQNNAGFIAQCGAYLDSELLRIDPVARKSYEHLEYRPLVNARAHKLGKTRQIVNNRFHQQYHQLMTILSCKPSLDDAEKMSIVYYLLLQDRIGEALAFFEDIDAQKLATAIQYDYLSAYLDFFNDEPSNARQLVKKYTKHPVDRWQKAFAAIQAQLDELDGKTTGLVDDTDRDQRQANLAKTEANIELQVVDRKVEITYQNIEQATVNYFLMDLELLFSRNPFVQQQSNQFSYIRPNGTQTVKLPKGKAKHAIELPQKFHNQNVLVEVSAAGKSRTQVYYSNSLTVQLIDAYGQVRVTTSANNKPLPRAYVKVFAKKKNGAITFFKDGYTDLRGKFDYTSLNTNEIDQVQRFAILIMSKDHGALVREAAPPRR